ncbi:DUF3263 domain-containing protein [Microbacterium sp. YY-01]|uniref:DUF3263 domain-containing protein n=1 Tax=Microbacterium sp. YY-01 TaxID=3421634 RepID=UPI003D1711FC
MVEQLSAQEQQILEFEARWLRHSGAKEEAIRAQLQLTPSRYYQLLDRLIDTQAALAYDPLLVRRLVRLRERGARHRGARRRDS